MVSGRKISRGSLKTCKCGDYGGRITQVVYGVYGAEECESALL